MKKLRLLKLNDLKKLVELVRDSSWINIHVFYKILCLSWDSVATTAYQQIVWGLLGKTGSFLAQGI